jgi:hypothetical protein
VVLTILKNIKVNGKDDIPCSMENKRCLKPPTSIIYISYIYTVMKIGKEKQHDLGLVPENPREYPETPVEFLKCSR